MAYYFGNPNSNPNYGQSAVNMAPPPSEFMLSDYLLLDDDVDHQESWSQSTESSEKVASSDASHGFGGATSKNNNMQVFLLFGFFCSLKKIMVYRILYAILCMYICMYLYILTNLRVFNC